MALLYKFKNTLYGFAVLVTLFWPAMALPQPSSRGVEGVSLALSLKAPPSVNDVSDFTITGMLKNEGSKDIIVVKDPNGILYEVFTADALVFERTGSKGEDVGEDVKKPSFVGSQAKWTMDIYLQRNIEEDDSDEDYSTAGNESSSNERRGTSDSESDPSGSDESDGDYHTDTSITGSTESGSKQYAPGTTIDLPAGKAIPISYKVGEVYDFSESGAGAYTFKLKRDYFYVLINDEVVNVKVKMDVAANTVKIQGKLAAADRPEEEELVLDEKVTYDDPDEDPDEDSDGSIGKRTRARVTRVTTHKCGPRQIITIDRAARQADKYILESNRYLANMTGPTTRYEYWFGDWNTQPKDGYSWAPRDQVTNRYKDLRKRSFLKPGHAGGYTYTCSCTETTSASVNWRRDLKPPAVAVIHLCIGFRARRTPIRGYNSKAGILIHEATHLTFYKPRADDISHYAAQCHHLANLSPFLAAINSDSYEYFSENEPHLD